MVPKSQICCQYSEPVYTNRCTKLPNRNEKTGSMFGSGIYTSYYSSKSLHYADNIRSDCLDINGQHKMGFLFLCNIDAGNIYNASRRY